MDRRTPERSITMNYSIDKDTQLDLKFKDKDALTIELSPNSSGTLTMNVEGSGAITIDINAQAHSHWKVLWINHSDGALDIIENVNVDEHADVRLIYGELSTGKHTKDTKVHLIGDHANVELIAAVLAFDELQWSMQADHKARNTEANLNTNAIILDDGKLRLDVEGKIAKGFIRSKTHQMSRILNLGKDTQGIVFPKLLIDENDVEASHAASVGQANDEHIFYLQSRGLTKLEALRLMIKGYLAPVIKEIDQIEIQEKLMEEIDKKVNDYVR